MRTKTENVMRYMPTGETYTVDLYEFHELNEDAQARIIDEYNEERQNDPYFSQWFADSQEHEIWQCVRDLEKSITGARVQWHYNRWYSCDFDCEYSYDDCYDPGEVETVEDNGCWCSMDVCDVWNAHVKRLNALFGRVEHIDYLLNYVYEDYNVSEGWTSRNDAARDKLDDMRGDLVALWYEELEKACDDVRRVIESDLRGEWEYYASEEYAREDFEANGVGYECRTIDDSGRVYYHDTRKWYTAAGELYEQSNVNHECVSIVKRAS